VEITLALYSGLWYDNTVANHDSCRKRPSITLQKPYRTRDLAMSAFHHSKKTVTTQERFGAKSVLGNRSTQSGAIREKGGRGPFTMRTTEVLPSHDQKDEKSFSHP